MVPETIQYYSPCRYGTAGDVSNILSAMNISILMYLFLKSGKLHETHRLKGILTLLIPCLSYCKRSAFQFNRDMFAWDAQGRLAWMLWSCI